MSVATRWHYYQRIFHAYLGPGRSQLTFWHEVPEINPRATGDRLGEYYMLFRQKADYAGHYDATGIPMLDYRGVIGLQYNPIAIAQPSIATPSSFAAGVLSNSSATGRAAEVFSRARSSATVSRLA